MITRAGAPLRAVSLFSNCGAGDIGYAKAGFAFEVMAELDERRLSVALLNHADAHGVPGDLRETLPAVVAAYRDRVGDQPPALLAACPPCQGMSSARSGRGHEADADAGSRDARNLLVQVVAGAVAELAPRAIVVENVQAFLTRKVRHPATGEPVSGARYLMDTLDADYVVYPLIADLADFGVPQSRRRSFLTFIRRTEPGLAILERRSLAPYPYAAGASGGAVALKDALVSFGLPPLDAARPETAASDVPMHAVPVWPAERYGMVDAIAPYSGASAWENDACTHCGQRTTDRGRVHCSSCGCLLPRPVTRGSDGEHRLVTGFHTSYRRMAPDEPAATITTASGHVGSDRTIHPWENRVLSPLECALLQTFPPTFQWGNSLERWGHTNVRAMIGEAVPPLFTQKHGRVLSQILRQIPPRLALSVNDRRIAAAHRALERATRAVEGVSELA